LQVHWSVT